MARLRRGRGMARYEKVTLDVQVHAASAARACSNKVNA